jgi:hypothetical protein
MSERDQRPEDDDLDAEIARLDAAGLAFPVGDQTLERAYDRLKPVQPSARFREEANALLAKLKRPDPPPLGATLIRWREAIPLSLPGLRQRLQIDPSVLQDLERDSLYPETLPVTFWRRYAEVLKRTTQEVADLIEGYDRATVKVGGLATARSGKTLLPEERAAFLSEDLDDQRARMDEKRKKLVAALRG